MATTLQMIQLQDMTKIIKWRASEGNILDIDTIPYIARSLIGHSVSFDHDFSILSVQITQSNSSKKTAVVDRSANGCASLLWSCNLIVY